MYRKGEGVLKDNKKACALYEKAANQGHASAQFGLGVMYDIDEGVPKDKSEAKYWMKKALENNDAEVSQVVLEYWNKYLAD